MELTPDLLLEAKFSPARRGYDMNEVDDFLERCAEGLDVLLTRLKAEFERAERAEERAAHLEAALGEARSAPQQAPAPAPAAEPAPVEAPPAPAPAPAAAPEPSPDVVQEPMRILIAAERTAEAAIAEARAEAERIRTEAESIASTTRSEAEALLSRSRSEAEAEARRAGEETRRSIEAEVLSLRQDRDALATDVRSLRRWLDEQRARLRTTARDLQRLVDDPAALRELPVPDLHDDAPAPAGAGSEPEAEPEPAPEAPAADDPTPPEASRTADGSDDMLVLDDVAGIAGDAGEPTQAVPAISDQRIFDDAVETANGDRR